MKKKVDGWILIPQNLGFCVIVYGAQAVAEYIYEKVLEPLGW